LEAEPESFLFLGYHFKLLVEFFFEFVTANFETFENLGVIYKIIFQIKFSRSTLIYMEKFLAKKR
jgi:hypothetical protein